MMESSGNLAYSLPRQIKDNSQRKIHTPEYRKRYNANPKRVAVKTESEEFRVAKLFHRQMARQRIGAIIASILIVSFIAVSFAGILYRSSKILEMNYANVKIEREIKKIAKDNNQLIEIMSKKTDLRVIRQNAIEKLGMQDPGQNQVVKVSIPVSDRLIIEEKDAKGDSEQTQLANALNNIEGFFKTIR